MSRVSAPGCRNGFPFVVLHAGEDKEPIETWDQYTWFGDWNPSKSATEKIRVVGPLTRHPAGMTLEQFSKFYWRVREWKIDYSSLTTRRYYIYQDASEMTGGEVDYSTANPPYSLARLNCEPVCEAPLACSGRIMIPTPTDDGITVTWSDDYGSAAGTASSTIFQCGPYYQTFWQDDKFFPPIRISIGVPFGNVGGVDSRSAYPKDLWNTDTTYEATSAVWTITMDDFTYSEALYGICFRPPTGTQTVTAATGAIAITPHKFWTYSGLYDETTGEPITPIISTLD